MFSFLRPGDFGYGNVTTGQVASRKYEILTRASSVGLSEREGLNPDLLSHSARASPAPPLFPVAVPPGTMQMKSMATGEAEMSVQVYIFIHHIFLSLILTEFYWTFWIIKITKKDEGVVKKFWKIGSLILYRYIVHK